MALPVVGLLGAGRRFLEVGPKSVIPFWNQGFVGPAPGNLHYGKTPETAGKRRELKRLGAQDCPEFASIMMQCSALGCFPVSFPDVRPRRRCAGG